MSETRETIDAVLALLDDARELANGLGYMETPGDGWNFGGFVRREIDKATSHIERASITLAERGYQPVPAPASPS